MSDRHRSELERRYLEAVKNLAFRSMNRRLAAERGIAATDLCASMQSDELEEALKMIRSLGDKIWILDGELIPDEG